MRIMNGINWRRPATPSIHHRLYQYWRHPRGQRLRQYDTAITNSPIRPDVGAAICSDKVMQVMWTGAKYAVTQNLDVIGAYYHYIQNDYTSHAAPIPQRTRSAPVRSTLFPLWSFGASHRSGMPILA